MEIFDKNGNFGQKSKFSTNIELFGQKSKFSPNIEIFGQKSKLATNEII